MLLLTWLLRHLASTTYVPVSFVTIWKSWLQAIELIPLPEGVPEVLHVTCNGRSGLLLVRTQRVQHGESEISASKFEQVCGKGDAKKWKCSIWTEAEDGSQDMVGSAC